MCGYRCIGIYICTRTRTLEFQINREWTKKVTTTAFFFLLFLLFYVLVVKLCRSLKTFYSITFFYYCFYFYCFFFFLQGTTLAFLTRRRFNIVALSALTNVSYRRGNDNKITEQVPGKGKKIKKNLNLLIHYLKITWRISTNRTNDVHTE